MNQYNQGTHYECGCWRGGKPSKHPDNCPTHDRPWRMRLEKIGTKSYVATDPIIRRRYNDRQDQD